MKKATLSFIILFIAVLLAPQSAQGVEEDLVKQTLRITKHTKDVNQTCPKDTQKYFKEAPVPEAAASGEARFARPRRPERACEDPPHERGSAEVHRRRRVAEVP